MNRHSISITRIQIAEKVERPYFIGENVKRQITTYIIFPKYCLVDRSLSNPGIYAYVSIINM